MEDAAGKPFVGDSGAELDRLLARAAHLSRKQIYISNIYKFRPSEDNDDPTEQQVKESEDELRAELSIVQPRYIISVGKIATAWFLDKPRDETDMDKFHGVPHYTPRVPGAILVPTYHPAAGLHQPERYQHLLYHDFEQVGKVVRDSLGVLKDEYPDPLYAETNSYSYSGLQGIDTEGTPANPWGISITANEGAGFVVKSGAALQKLGPAQYIGHHWLWDLPVLRKMGLELEAKDLHDSMLLAYVLPWLPRGLKALAYRLCGMEMEDYEEVIKDAEAKVCKEYLEKVLAARACSTCNGATTVQQPYKRQPDKFRTVKCEHCAGDGTSWPQPVRQFVPDSTGVLKGYKPQSVGRRVRRALERGNNLRESWQSVDGEVRLSVETELGTLRPATLDDVEPERAINYSARDCDATLRVFNKLKPMVEKEGLWPLYELDKSIIPIVDRMHHNGILIDRSHFSALDRKFTEEQLVIKDKLCSLVGHQFNPASPKQVGEILYGEFKLKPPKRDAGTDEKTLENLKLKYRDDKIAEFVNLELEFRELGKLKGTYVDPIPAAADRNNRVHTRFLLHVTTSGRLSSRDPNLQNCPSKTERGRLIRQGFIAEEGCSLLSVDLDQIELRVGAHLASDENMIEIFRSGEDIHYATASKVYQKPVSEIDSTERLLIKTISYGIFYGMSPKRLQNELALMGLFYSLDECVGFINAWFRSYPGIATLIKDYGEQARSQGYVSCLFGRRRYLPGVHSAISGIREESLRFAANHPIQGTAAGILKLWMSAVWEKVLPAVQCLGRVEPLLTVHDELIFSCKTELAPLVQALVIAEASNTIQLLVPIKAKGKTAQNWAELK